MNTDNAPLAIITLTAGGKKQALRIKAQMACDCYTMDNQVSAGFYGFNGSMANCVEQLFKRYSSLLFICATGITVRMIAPWVSDKFHDPAVLVMDEQGQYIISLLSGHVGGANQLARQLANQLGAIPIITTATDVNNVGALDTLIQQLGCPLEPYRQQIKTINQRLVSDQRVGIYLDQITLDPQLLRGFVIVDDLDSLPEDLATLIVVSYRTNVVLPSTVPIIQLVPKWIVVGIGCRRNTTHETLYQMLCEHLDKHHIALAAIQQIGSVSIKENEHGLIALSQQLHVPFNVFPIDLLKQHEHRFPQSEFVKTTLGIGSVSQPVSWVMSQGHLIGETLKKAGITITLGVKTCCI